jgi:hypothetical protein
MILPENCFEAKRITHMNLKSISLYQVNISKTNPNIQISKPTENPNLELWIQEEYFGKSNI